MHDAESSLDTWAVLFYLEPAVHQTHPDPNHLFTNKTDDDVSACKHQMGSEWISCEQLSRNHQSEQNWPVKQTHMDTVKRGQSGSTKVSY